MKYARCAHCKHFFTVNKMDVQECDGCTYRTYRCRGAKCAGKAGTSRSIRMHAAYWRVRRDGLGGHGA